MMKVSINFEVSISTFLEVLSHFLLKNIEIKIWRIF